MKHTMRNLTRAALAVAIAMTVGQSQSSAEDLFTVGADNTYQIFNSDDLTAAPATGTISGIAADDSILGLDFRANGGGIWAVTASNNLYSINTTTFAATLQSNGPLVPALSDAGTLFGLDFNPQAQGGILFRTLAGDTQNNRVISTGTNDYLFPNPGDPDQTDVFYAVGDANEGATPNIQANAYDNNIVLPSSTQQFGIDTSLGNLVTVANNAGTLVTQGSLGLGSLSNLASFDISGDTGVAFAALQVDGGVSQLYTIDVDLTSATLGQANLVGSFGGSAINDFTVIPASASIPEPSSAAILALGLGVLCVRRKR